MSGYRQFCPVAKGAEVFAERWTPMILRELLAGSNRFNQLLEGVPRMSPALLAQRLRSLERQGIIEKRQGNGRGPEYHLTRAGMELKPVVETLAEWGQHWATDQLEDGDLDASFLMWAMHRHIQVDRLPRKPMVVRFEFKGLPRERYWLLSDPPKLELCITDYGFDIDLFVRADLAALTQVYLGKLPIGSAMERRPIEVDGPPSLVRAFPKWLGCSSYARYAKQAMSSL